MSFQFVNVTPDNTEHNDETRRRIRSQAMRDYRRRQRVEEESTGSSLEGSPSTLSSPQQPSAGQSRHGSRPRKSSTQSLPLKPGVLRRQSSGTSRDEPLPIEDLGGAKGKRCSPHLDDDRSSSPRRRKRTEEMRAQHGIFGTFSIKLPKPSKQSQLTLEDIDPLSSPGQLDQMIGICESYNRWLISNMSSGPAESEMNGPWDNPTSQMLLFALCLKSIGHLDALQRSQFGGNKRLFKTRVLALANKRLKNPAKALEDKTIGALACLTSYEISRGSPEAMMHLSGLSQIIKLRGGVDKVGHRGGLYMFLEMLDLIHAVYFRTTPMYTSVDKSQPSSHEDTPELPALDDPPGPNQDMLDEISNFIMNIPELIETDESFPDLFQTEPAVTALAFNTEVQQWHHFLTQAAQSIGPSSEEQLAYACGLAARLHLATTSVVSAHPMRIQAQTEELFTTMANLPDDAWDAFQMLHVRILLTALSADRNVSQKSWYNAHLTRRLYQMERESWSTAKSLMLRFIDMQAAAKQPRAQTVRTLVNDIEIVVNSSEARENALPIQTSLIDPNLSATGL